MNIVADLPTFVQSNVDVTEFTPFEYYEPGQGMQTFGEFHLIRAGASGNGTLVAGIWRIGEAVTSPVYTSDAGDETFLVLEGSVTIKLIDTGEEKHFKAGDVGSWSRGTRTQWTFSAPFKKLVIVAHDSPPPEGQA